MKPLSALPFRACLKPVVRTENSFVTNFEGITLYKWVRIADYRTGYILFLAPEYIERAMFPDKKQV